jgi:four helix bundle protein
MDATAFLNIRVPALRRTCPPPGALHAGRTISLQDRAEMVTEHPPARTTLSPMSLYERLDSWKACHALALCVYEATRPLLEQNQDIAERLRLAALLSACKLARGAGTGSRALMRQCAELSAGHLSEVGYHLKLAWATNLISPETYRRLDALRGRASFYVWKELLAGSGRPKDEPRNDGEWGRQMH